MGGQLPRLPHVSHENLLAGWTTSQDQCRAAAFPVRWACARSCQRCDQLPKPALLGRTCRVPVPFDVRGTLDLLGLSFSTDTLRGAWPVSTRALTNTTLRKMVFVMAGAASVGAVTMSGGTVAVFESYFVVNGSNARTSISVGSPGILNVHNSLFFKYSILLTHEGIHASGGASINISSVKFDGWAVGWMGGLMDGAIFCKQDVVAKNLGPKDKVWFANYTSTC